MKHKSNIALIVASITLVAGIVITGVCFLITGGFFSYSWNWGEGPTVDHFAFFNTSWSDEYEAKRESLPGESAVIPLDSFTGIDVGVASAGVTLIPSDENKIEYRLSSHEKIKKCGVNSNGVLEFKTKSGFSISFLNFGIKGEYVKIYYKSTESLDSINIATVSGYMDIPDIEANDFNLVTVSGDITTGELIGDGLNVSSTSGSVDISTADIGKAINASSTSGDVSINKITNTEVFNGSTVSGEIRIDECVKIDKTEISTVSSDIVISGDFGEANFHTTSGEIKATSTRSEDDYRVTTSTVSGDCIINGNEIKKNWGNGSMLIDCGTVSGDIEINFRG